MVFIRILIIDDHPFVVQSYKKVIIDYFMEHSPMVRTEFQCAHSCKDAYDILYMTKVNKSKFDLVLLDIRIPPYPEKNLISGEDIGSYLRLNLPDTRVIILTSISNKLRILNILREINPEGFLLKSDINHHDIKNAVEKALKYEKSRSQTILKMLEHQLTSASNFDDLDRKILFHLSMGESSKNLPDILPLSLSAIEKRKRKLAKYFGLSSTSTSKILQAARENEYL